MGLTQATEPFVATILKKDLDRVKFPCGLVTLSLQLGL